MGLSDKVNEKVAIVTGGGSGIGAASAKKLADEGINPKLSCFFCMLY